MQQQEEAQHGTRKIASKIRPGLTCISGMDLTTLKLKKESWKSLLRPHESFSTNESKMWLSYQINTHYLHLALADVTAGLQPIALPTIWINRY